MSIKKNILFHYTNEEMVKSLIKFIPFKDEEVALRKEREVL